MILVTKETFNHRDVYYRKEVDDSGKIVSSERYDCKTFVYQGSDGKQKIFIGDRLDIIRPLPFEYVNITRVNTSIGSRIQMAEAIQLLYAFCDIYNYRPDNLTGTAADGFVRFLEGLDVKNEPGTEPTFRTAKTINSILGMVRAFLRYMGLNQSVNGFGMLEYYKGTAHTEGGRAIRINIQKKNTLNKRQNGLAKLHAPKHYKPSEAKKIVDLMVASKDYQTYIAFRLGTELGLRRGEILGLTIEDVKKITNTTTGEINYKLYLRNRMSDTPDQCAKMLPHISNTNVYQTNTYRKYSKEEVDISESIYDMLRRYFFSSRNADSVGVKAHDAIQKATLADSVYTTGVKNYYIFFNEFRGRYYRLSAQTFNNHLKKYFEMAGLDLSNVSHAMRHSFAMFHAYYAKKTLSQLELQVLMRHASAESTAIYFNLPDKEIKRLRDEYSAEMEHYIPDYKVF